MIALMIILPPGLLPAFVNSTTRQARRVTWACPHLAKYVIRTSQAAVIAQKACAVGEPEYLAQLFKNFSDARRCESVTRQDRDLRPPELELLQDSDLCLSCDLAAKCDAREPCGDWSRQLLNERRSAFTDASVLG